MHIWSHSILSHTVLWTQEHLRVDPGGHQGGGVEGEREFRHVSILVVFGEAHLSYPNSCSNPTFSYVFPLPPLTFLLLPPSLP